MDEELRDSLMEWYLRYGERVIENTPEFMMGEKYKPFRAAFLSDYIAGTIYNNCSAGFYISPEGIEALKNG